LIAQLGECGGHDDDVKVRVLYQAALTPRRRDTASDSRQVDIGRDRRPGPELPAPVRPEAGREALSGNFRPWNPAYSILCATGPQATDRRLLSLGSEFLRASLWLRLKMFRRLIWTSTPRVVQR
jgi:hypothetical protein